MANVICFAKAKMSVLEDSTNRREEIPVKLDGDSIGCVVAPRRPARCVGGLLVYDRPRGVPVHRQGQLEGARDGDGQGGAPARDVAEEAVAREAW
jgi:hypothetical protein